MKTNTDSDASYVQAGSFGRRSDVVDTSVARQGLVRLNSLVLRPRAHDFIEKTEKNGGRGAHWHQGVHLGVFPSTWLWTNLTSFQP